MKKPLCTVDELPTDARVLVETLLGEFATILKIDEHMSHAEAVESLKTLLECGLARLLLDEDGSFRLVAVQPDGSQMPMLH